MDPLALARHARTLETISFHAGRYWPLEAALWDLSGKALGVAGRGVARGASATGSRPTRRGASCGRRSSVPRTPWRSSSAASAPSRSGSRATGCRRGRRRSSPASATRSATRLEIIVDLNQWWRMAGDIEPRPRPGRRARRDRAAARARRPVGRGAAGRRATSRDGLAACADRACGSRGGEMARDVRGAAGSRSTPTRSTSTSPTSCSRWGSRARARSPSSRCGATGGSPRTPGPTGSACWPTCTSAPASAAGPYLEFPYDPPGWTPERRDFMLAEPVAIDAEAWSACPTRPGSGSARRGGGGVLCGADPAVSAFGAAE